MHLESADPGVIDEEASEAIGDGTVTVDVLPRPKTHVRQSEDATSAIRRPDDDHQPTRGQG